MSENDDVRLNALAAKLGERAAARLDAEATADAVVRRLREPAAPARRWTWAQPAWLRIAAALVILVGGAALARRVLVRPAVGSHAAHFVTDDLTDLTADQLRDVLDSLDETLDSARTVPADPALEDLDAQQLRSVLRSLEG